jgi:hypothetical protein
MEKETKIEAHYFKEKKFKFPKFNKSWIPVLAAIIIVVIVVFIYVFSLSKADKKEPAVTAAKECGALVAENNKLEGTVPFAPKLTGKLGGNYDSNKAVCHWKIDGGISHATFPVNGSCVFAMRAIATPGEHTISYEVDGLKKNCPQSIKIKVNKK